MRIALDVPTATATSAQRAIYLAFARDGRLHYIGKVDRTGGTAVQRLGPVGE